MTGGALTSFTEGVAASIVAAGVVGVLAWFLKSGHLYVGGVIGQYRKMHSRRGWKIVSTVEDKQVRQMFRITLQLRGRIWGVFEIEDEGLTHRYSLRGRFHNKDVVGYSYQLRRWPWDKVEADFGFGVVILRSDDEGYGKVVGFGPEIVAFPQGLSAGDFTLKGLD